jgi:hypothetical protein
MVYILFSAAYNKYGAIFKHNSTYDSSRHGTERSEGSTTAWRCLCVLLVRESNVLTVILFPEHIDSRVKGRIIVIYISVEFVYVVLTIEESQKSITSKEQN